MDILIKLAESQNEITTIDTLIYLAKIVNENESQRMASSAWCIPTIVTMLKRITESKEKEYTFVLESDDGSEHEFGREPVGLSRGLGSLASSDANKVAIVQNGGIPVLAAILRPTYTDEQKQAAAEGLWKLSFLESTVDAVLTHLTFTDTIALEGRLQIFSMLITLH